MLAFAGGLMAKPMVVTLPVVLVLMDIWPLQRIDRESWRRLILEKVPLFVMAVASAVVTFAVQHASGAVKALDVLPPSRRLAAAMLGYIEYLGNDEGNRVLYELSIELLRAGQLEPALQEIEVILRNDPTHQARDLLTSLAARQRAGGAARQ